MIIEIHPTRRKERLGDMEYRVFTGKTSTGLDIEMLGLFRVMTAGKQEEFYRALCAVDVGDPSPVSLIGDERSLGLVRT